MLSVINGDSGDRESPKVIKSVFNAILDKQVRSRFTWTGKSINGEKKIPFRDYKEIIGLLFNVVRRANNKYTMVKCEEDLTTRILKYAAAKKKDNKKDKDSSNCENVQSQAEAHGSTSNNHLQNTFENQVLCSTETSDRTVNQSKLLQFVLKMCAENKI